MPVTERVRVFAAGVGVIEPTSSFSDMEVLRASDEAQKPIEDPYVVCMDERPAVGEKQPVREKVAGGLLITSVHAAAAIEWSGFSEQQLEDGPESMLDIVADQLMDTGESLGAHRHNTIEHDNETGCGAIDKSPQAVENIAEHGPSDVFVENARIDLGDAFNEDHWRRAHGGFVRMARDPHWREWRTSRIQETVEAKGGVVETLDGAQDAFKPDPDNRRHNHWGESARIGDKAGHSNDRDNATIPGFQVDKDPLIRASRKMGRNEEEASLLLHAELLFQYGTMFTLTKNMRIIR